MTLDGLISQAQRVPTLVWFAGAAMGLVWLTRPRPSAASDSGHVLGSQDIQAMSDHGTYNPVGAHAFGLPYDLGHLCPVHWTGRTKAYPHNSHGAIGMLAAPDPADDDGYAWLSYGPQRGSS